jgi:hypothetical protein
MEVYVIKRLWVDCFQTLEHKTYGYETIGYHLTYTEAEMWIDNQEQKDYTVNDCWSIKGTIPEYKIEKVEWLEKL